MIDGIARPGARGRAPQARRPVSVRRAVGQFAAASLAAVGLIGFAGVQLLNGASRREAIGDAKELSRLAGRGIIQPLLSDLLLIGDARALARLNSAVHASVLGHGIVRVKIWTPGGRVVYSDAPGLIGAVFPLSQAELSTLRSNRGVAEQGAEASAPENRSERGMGKLIAVYLAIHTPSGQPLLFESFLPSNEISESARHLWMRFAPALLGGIALLALIQMPLAWSLATRLRRRQQERAALLAHAVQASDDERRRIARDLHDGVVQELAGVAYALAAAADSVATQPRDAIEASLLEVAGQTRRSIRSLRSLLVDIYPPSLQSAGLQAALSDLVARVTSGGPDTRLEFSSELTLAPEGEAMLYRVAQEALRNVFKHARATRADVSVSSSGATVTLTVSDDGVGFSAGAQLEREGEDHLGLGLIADLVREQGGRLELTSSPGEGTTVRVEVDQQ